MALAASAVGARFLTGTLPRPRLPTAPAVTYNQNVNQNENQKAMAIAASAVGARFLTGTLPCPRLPTAPAVTYNQNVNGNENQKAMALAASNFQTSRLWTPPPYNLSLLCFDNDFAFCF